MVKSFGLSREGLVRSSGSVRGSEPPRIGTVNFPDVIRLVAVPERVRTDYLILIKVENVGKGGIVFLQISPHRIPGGEHCFLRRWFRLRKLEKQCRSLSNCQQKGILI